MTEKEFIEHFDKTHPNLKEIMGESNYNFVKNWLHGAYSMGYTEKANEIHNTLDIEIKKTKEFVKEAGNMSKTTEGFYVCLQHLKEVI